MKRAEHLLTLDFVYRDAVDRKIPVSVFTKSVNSAQRIVNMIANEIEGKHDNERDRLSSERSDKYNLYFQDFRIGSAHSVFSIGDPASDALAPDDLDKVSSQFTAFTLAIIEKSEESLSKIFVKKDRRIKAIKTFREILPDSKTGIDLSIGIDDLSLTLDYCEVSRNVDSIIQKEFENEDSVVLKGVLNRIFFDKNEFQFYHIPTAKNLKVSYPDELEVFLLNHPRDIIQISAKAILNSDMNVSEISEIYHAEAVDLSPLIIESFHYDDEEFHLKNPLTLDVFLDESQQLYCVQAEDIALILGAETREELLDDIQDKLAFLWNFYVEGDVEASREDVWELKQNLMQLMGKN